MLKMPTQVSNTSPNRFNTQEQDSKILKSNRIYVMNFKHFVQDLALQHFLSRFIKLVKCTKVSKEISKKICYEIELLDSYHNFHMETFVENLNKLKLVFPDNNSELKFSAKLGEKFGKKRQELNTRKIFLLSIPKNIRTAQIKSLLAHFGKIEDVDIKQNKVKPYNFGFVTFKKKEAAECALRAQKIPIQGWSIIVKPYNSGYFEGKEKPVKNKVKRNKGRFKEEKELREKRNLNSKLRDSKNHNYQRFSEHFARPKPFYQQTHQNLAYRHKKTMNKIKEPQLSNNRWEVNQFPNSASKKSSSMNSNPLQNIKPHYQKEGFRNRPKIGTSSLAYINSAEFRANPVDSGRYWPTQGFIPRRNEGNELNLVDDVRRSNNRNASEFLGAFEPERESHLFGNQQNALNEVIRISRRGKIMRNNFPENLRMNKNFLDDGIIKSQGNLNFDSRIFFLKNDQTL